MTWIINWANQEISSDDFTLDELGRIEKEADTSWSIANPLRTAAVAKAFLRVAIAKAGDDPSTVDTLTLGKIKRLFDFRADDEAEVEQEGGGDEPDPLPLSIQDSSPGESVASLGRPRKRAVNA